VRIPSRPAEQPANPARFCFLDPRALDLDPDWDDIAASTVAVLRSSERKKKT
jgi:hypothetical protein